ncbi:MAG: hypothetical protein DWQ02_27805 [Bacteroidetes bacterium]|nr:MAG: hypothetical protein DWQ02_27805 [Bacteroidota bacterium]
MDASRLILINRNDSKANHVASRLGVKSETFSNLPDYLKRSDIVMVATGSPNPIITTDLLAEKKTGIFFDLSVPSNISQEVKKLDGVIVYDLDGLSRLANRHVGNRKKALLAALPIVDQYLEKFNTWYERRLLFKNMKLHPKLN